jgi:DNA primase
MDVAELIRSHGRGFLRQAGGSFSLADMLWLRAMMEGDSSTPEGRAAIEKRVFADVDKIEDETVRKYYRAALKAKLDVVLEAPPAEKEAKRTPSGKSRLAHRKWKMKPEDEDE